MTDHVTESVVRAVAETGGRFTGSPHDTPARFVAALLVEGWTPPAPPPLTDEPTDLAARVIDKHGCMWARNPDQEAVNWADLSRSCAERSWNELLSDVGPLRLWEPSGE